MRKLIVCAVAFAASLAPARAEGNVSDVERAWTGELPSAFKSGAAVPALETTGPRAQLVAGDCSRFARVFTRLERGERVRLAVVGGSITQGAGASSRAKIR